VTVAGTGTAAAAGPSGSRPTSPAGSRPTSPTARDVLRRLRFALVLAALILATGAGAALLQAHTGPAYLDPNDPGPFGSRALAQILAQRGQHVVPVNSPAQAAHATHAAQATHATNAAQATNATNAAQTAHATNAAQAAQAAHATSAAQATKTARAAPGDSTLVITGPAFLDGRELAALAGLPGDRVLVEPDAPELRALAPGVGGRGVVPVGVTEPVCGLAPARLAGNADMGGVALSVSAPGAQQCYPGAKGPSLVRYVAGGRSITVLGTGVPLTNGSLADRGNAALALNLLAGRSTIVWLTPGPAALTATGAGRTSVRSLIPWGAYLVAIQLAVAVVAAAVWRARRLGPLVTEPLPVVVRAAETVEGHGRLYRSRHSRGRAAEALRSAAIGRLVPRLGLAPGVEPATIAAAVAAHSGRDVAAVAADLFGQAPGTDAALVELASNLDTLEREVRTT